MKRQAPTQHQGELGTFADPKTTDDGENGNDDVLINAIATILNKTCCTTVIEL